MKKQDLKQWVLEKRRSLTDKLAPSRNDQIDHQSNLAIRTNSASMDIDTLVHDNSSAPLQKTTFAVKGGYQFRVNARYSYLKTLGFGAYGVVCAAQDTQTNKHVAVKKVAGVFDDLTDAKRIVREMRLLRSMNHDNILKVIDIDEPENYTTFNDVYIVTELMDTDLNKLIRHSAKLLDSQRKFMIYNLFRALKYIHRYVLSIGRICTFGSLAHLN